MMPDRPDVLTPEEVAELSERADAVLSKRPWTHPGIMSAEAVLIAATYAALRAQARPTWQSMETAPKDGTTVLLLLEKPKGGYVNVGGDVHIGWWFGSWLSEEEQYWASANLPASAKVSPRGWQPLPPPPAAEAQE